MSRLGTSPGTPALYRVAKRVLRDAFWAIRGAAVANPPVPPRPGSVLFVCKGNVCRSPFAARALARRLEALGDRGPAVASAGYLPSRDGGPPPEAVRAASDLGVSLEGHRPSGLTAATVEAADMVVVMEPAQASRLRKEFGARASRLFLMSLFEEGPAPGGWRRYHIADPYGRDAAAFEDCYRRIERCLSGMIRAWGEAAGR